MLKYCILLFIGLMPSLLKAQSPIYYKIGEEIFWNKDIYTVLYDEETQLTYVGTNSGLFISKENTFVRLKGPESQIGFSFFDLQKDKNGQVFCNNINGQIFKINSELESYELYYQLSEYEKKGGLLWCYFTSSNHLFIASKFSITILNSNRKIIKTITKINDENILRVLKTDKINNQIYLEVTLQNSPQKLNLYSYHNEALKKVATQDNLSYKSSSGFMIHKNRAFSINKIGTLNYTREVMQDFEPQELERYFNINDTCILAQSAQKGYRYISLYQDSLKTTETILPNSFISAFYQTSSGQFILGTFGDGLLVVTNPDIRKYEHELLFLDIATTPDNKVAISSRSGEILQIENNKAEVIDKKGRHIDHIFYCGNNNRSIKLGFNDFVYSDLNKIGIAIRDLKIISDDILIFTDFSGIRIEIDEELARKTNLDRISSKIIISDQRFQSLEWDGIDSLIYYTTNLGVYSKKWSLKKSKPLLFNNQKFTANDILFFNSKLFCATNLDGILIFENNILTQQIGLSEGLDSKIVKQILIQNDKLYILTPKGIQLYDLLENKFINLPKSDDYQRVTKMALSENKLWLLEKHGYFSVDLDHLQKSFLNTDSLKVFINKIVVNNSEIDFIKNIDNVFSYDENRFEFTYDYRQIFNKNKTQLFYQLKGLNNEWKNISTHKNSILFQSLLPGKYTFSLKAKLNNTESKPYIFSFEIKHPYWQTWWFYLTIFIFIFSGVSLYFILKIKTLKIEERKRLEKHKLITQTINSELKAIRAQMNPHFIFNAINSIQDLVLQNDTLKSYDALVQFSKLVRNTLDYSEKEFIYLEQEIDFLETYLGLERLRFKTNFDYQITNHVKGDLRIPSIVIQPFVENAIKHGLLHKTGQKKLNIEFKLLNKQLICSITDNGIGIEKSKKIQNRQKMNHTSFSTNAITKRFEILEKKFGQKCYYTNLEILDETNKIAGTQVKVYFPLIEKVDYTL